MTTATAPEPRPTEERPKWRANPGPQTSALQSAAYETLMGGARGGGKTSAGMAWLTRHIADSRYRALVIRRNATDLSDWLDRAREMYSYHGGRIVGNPPEIRWPSGARFRVGHLADAESYSKYMGHEYHRVLVEELTQIATEQQYLALIASCRSTTLDLPPRVFATTNPGGPGHQWVRQRFIDPAPPLTYFVDPVSRRTRVFVPARVEDCPQLMLGDPDYVRSLDALQAADEELYKAWRLGLWDVFSGQYFREWRRDQHVCRPFKIPDDWLRWAAVDYGFADPWCVLWAARDPESRRIYVYREVYRTGVRDEVQAELLKRLQVIDRTPNWFLDPSMFNQRREQGKDSIAASYERAGLPVQRAPNARIAGWSAVRRALAWRNEDGSEKPPRLQVFDVCTELIRTLPLMQHDPLNVEDLADRLHSQKTEDHAADCLRYLLAAEQTGGSDSRMETVERSQ